jgi:apolipoprotein N-acyltransferase
MIFSVMPLARRIAALSGWRRNVFAFAMGVFATLTLAPFYLFPLLLPAFSGLLWLLDAAPSRRRMFLDGWWWGWGFYMSGLYWFCIALLTDPAKFGWLIPPTLFGLTGLIALHSGLACWIMSWIRVRGISKIVVFTVVWTLVGWLRGHWFSGFPWNLEGYSFAVTDASLQMASVGGIYGLTWFAVLLGTSPVALGVRKKGIVYACALWALFVSGSMWGAGRLHQANAIPEPQRYVKGVMLRLVQANISQPHKWEPSRQQDGLKAHAQLTRSPGLDNITHVIWPETSVPFVVNPGTPIASFLGRLMPENTLLIAGALRSEGEQNRDFRLWNTLVAVNDTGSVVAGYDKIHLVPFGEFLPLRFVLPRSWTTPVGDMDFSRGEGGRLVEFPGLPPSLPLICYEVIFPELSLPDTLRPQWLLSVTNDAWFGSSSGPYQHFDMARMRAVEQGVPLVRVANTGISAVVDSFGQVQAMIPLHSRGILDAHLPVALPDEPFYRHFSHAILPLLLGVGVGLVIYQQRVAKN